MQAAPFRVNDAGRGLLPVCVALKPKLTDAPAARAPFHDVFVAVT